MKMAVSLAGGDDINRCSFHMPSWYVFSRTGGLARRRFVGVIHPKSPDKRCRIFTQRVKALLPPLAGQ